MTFPSAKDMSRMRGEMLSEIDDVIQGTPHWQGGRLDTIKYLVRLADIMSERLVDDRREREIEVYDRVVSALKRNATLLSDSSWDRAAEWVEGMRDAWRSRL